MKKYFYTLLFFLLTVVAAFAQTHLAEQDTLRHKEVGVDVTRLVLSMLSTNDVTAVTPYIFTFKSIKNNKGFRIGLGMDASGLKRTEDNNVDVQTNDFFVNLRLGHEWQFPLTKRWMTYIGADGVLGYSNSKSVSTAGEFEPTRVELSNYTFSYGAGVATGIQFRINSRLQLGTEGALYARLFNDKNTIQQGGPFVFKQERKGFGYNLQTSLPTNIYFIVIF